MEKRDSELWGMLWRFVLAMTLTAIAAGIAQALFGGLAGVIAAITVWMIPMYLANRALSRSSGR